MNASATILGGYVQTYPHRFVPLLIPEALCISRDETNQNDRVGG